MNVHFEYDHDYLPPAPVIEVTVDGYVQNTEPVVIRAMIDSGADGTMIPALVLAKSVRKSATLGSTATNC